MSTPTWSHLDKVKLEALNGAKKARRLGVLAEILCVDDEDADHLREWAAELPDATRERILVVGPDDPGGGPRQVAANAAKRLVDAMCERGLPGIIITNASEPAPELPAGACGVSAVNEWNGPRRITCALEKGHAGPHFVPYSTM